MGSRDLRKGDVIGCSLDLTVPEIRFTVNGSRIEFAEGPERAGNRLGIVGWTAGSTKIVV